MQAHMIAAYASCSRECDGLVRQIATERARCTGRANVTTLAYLEQMLASREDELAKLDIGATEAARATPDTFWAIVERERRYALASAKKQR